jgi:hypothetical protein
MTAPPLRKCGKPSHPFSKRCSITSAKLPTSKRWLPANTSQNSCFPNKRRLSNASASIRRFCGRLVTWPSICPNRRSDPDELFPRIKVQSVRDFCVSVNFSEKQLSSYRIAFASKPRKSSNRPAPRIGDAAKPRFLKHSAIPSLLCPHQRLIRASFAK